MVAARLVVITSLDFHIGWYRVLFVARPVRFCWRGRHRLLVVFNVGAVVRQQRRRSTRGRWRDRFAFFNQFDYLVSFFGQVAIGSERIIPTVRTETRIKRNSNTRACRVTAIQRI